MIWFSLSRRRKPLTPSEAANKRRVYIFTLCILCSALFWLFTKLSQETSAEFYKYVKFDSFPDELLPASQTDSILKYRLQTTGVRLINSYFFSRTDTITISADALPLIKKGGKQYYYITDGRFTDILSQTTLPGANIYNVRPDSIFLELVPAVNTKLPISLNADIAFEQRFRQYGEVLIEPDSVKVKGPKTIIDTLQYISTEFWAVGRLRQTADQLLRLIKPQPGKSVILDQDYVRVVVPVAEYTESTIELPVQINCPDDISPAETRLFPNKVTVSYLVALQDYTKVSGQMFSADVDCPHVSLNSDGRLDVRLETYPSFIQILAVRPSFVEYIILE